MWKLLQLKNKWSLKTLFTTVFFLSCLALIFSFYMELVIGIAPCFLCRIQRYIYFFLVPASLIGGFTFLKSIGRKCCILFFALGCLVSFYHSLVQFGILSDKCQTQTNINSSDEYKKLLLNKDWERIPCSSRSWDIQKIPISVFNGMISVFFLCLLVRNNQLSSQIPSHSLVR